VRTYGLLDLGLAALYGWLGFHLLPSRSLVFNGALALVVALLVVSGLGLLTGARWARALGLVASLTMIGFVSWLLLGLVASSAYLAGVYGPLGKGMAVLSIGIAALVVELFGLVPLFQLRFLLKQK
jgi:hypothetical protein